MNLLEETQNSQFFHFFNCMDTNLNHSSLNTPWQDPCQPQSRTWRKRQKSWMERIPKHVWINESDPRSHFLKIYILAVIKSDYKTYSVSV